MAHLDDHQCDIASLTACKVLPVSHVLKSTPLRSFATVSGAAASKFLSVSNVDDGYMSGPKMKPLGQHLGSPLPCLVANQQAR
jgi:hypothetical protein